MEDCQVTHKQSVASAASHAATVRVARPRLGGLWLVLGISGPLHSIGMSGVTVAVLTMTSFVKHLFLFIYLRFKYHSKNIPGLGVDNTGINVDI